MGGNLVCSDDEKNITQFFLLAKKIEIFQEEFRVFIRGLDQFVVTRRTIFEHVDRRRTGDFILMMAKIGIMLNCTCFARDRRLSRVHSFHRKDLFDKFSDSHRPEDEDRQTDTDADKQQQRTTPSLMLLSDECNGCSRR